jgi:hypothetical protein
MKHSWVLIKHPRELRGIEGEAQWTDEGWQYPMPILLHTDTEVWIEGSYSMEGHPEVKHVGDGRSKGYDQHGNCILSVPASWCMYYTEEEANSIVECMDADERLLRYAQ